MPIRTSTRSFKAPICEINMIPYIDVMLVLLIVFMACMPVLQQGMRLDLPKVDYFRQQLPPPPERVISIAIDSAGRHFIQMGERTPEYGPLQRGDLLQQLQQYTEGRHLGKSEVYIQLKGEANMSYQLMAETLVALHRAEYANVALLTQSDLQE